MFFFDDEKNFEDYYVQKYTQNYDDLHEELYQQMSWEKEELKQKYPVLFKKYQEELKDY